MMVIGIPVAKRISSAVTFCVLPGLMVPMLNAPGLARAIVSMSCVVRSGELARTRIILSNIATVEIGAKAVSGSNGMVLISDFDSAIPLDITNSV